MANLSISVNEDLYSITTDVYDWTGMTVNGQSVGGTIPPFTYSQTTPGPLQFVLTADAMGIVNANNILVLNGRTICTSA